MRVGRQAARRATAGSGGARVGQARSRRDETIRPLHVITDLSFGGAEMMLCKLLEGRRDSGPAHVLTLMAGDGPLARRIEAAGVQVHSLGLRRGAISPAAILRARRLVRELRPGLIHGWMYHANLLATLARATLAPAADRPPLLWNIRHTPATGRDKALTRAIIRLGAPLSRLPAAIVYNSTASLTQHTRLGYAGGRAQVIPNGFDCALFRPRAGARAALGRQLGRDDRTVLIGMVAAVRPMKDHGNMLAAMGRLVAAALPAHLVLVGRGADESNRALGEAIARAGLGTHVTLLGERTETEQLIAGFDVVALSSAWGEAFPNVLGEAMACGVPCVATDVGDCARIIADTGVVVRPADPAALAAGLGELVRLGPAARRRLGRAARQRIEGRFAIAQVVAAYEDLQRRTSAPARSRPATGA